MFIEINLFKTKWLIGGFYNPKKQLIVSFINAISPSLEKYLETYDNILLMGDFNSEVSEEKMREFCDVFNLKSLISQPTCFKSILNPSCIDLILTNKAKCFQNSAVIETGISDHHKLVVTVLKSAFKKKKPKHIVYRDYKKFSNDTFSREFQYLIMENAEKGNLEFDKINDICMSLLNKYAPLKTKILRGKAIMKRSRLKNQYNKLKTSYSYNDFKKQRNFCTSLLRKIKFQYFSNLKETDLSDNRKFWKVVKPLFSGKGSNDQINLVENETTISDDKTAK